MSAALRITATRAFSRASPSANARKPRCVGSSRRSRAGATVRGEAEGVVTFTVVVELHAVVTVDAVDDNSARAAAWRNLENKLPFAAKALGAELELDEIVASEPIHGEPNKADDAEPFYRPQRFRKQA